ncbi:transposable element gene [Prunus dulcis]|uniref:Transposable element protein n=1 Tax=Prunus dulcis TaxID=3755 RepID=A0A5H2XJ98_PRUDU|nr:transposable element gene [Prunus dulcis]
MRDEVDAIPLSALPVPQSTRDSESSEHKADGSIDRYKARLVVKGYTRTDGVDYLETLAPVAKLNTVRVLLSVAANCDWPLLQFDVKNAFLHGDLKEDIYMDLPPGILVTSKEDVSPRAWFGRFAASVKKFGYVQSNSDHTLFLKRHKKYLASEFEMKSLGDLKYFLEIEVARSKHETVMLDCKPIDTPNEQNHKLGLYPDQVHTDKEHYQLLVRKLIYLSNTRPNIAYAVSVASQFMHSPSEDHMGAVMRILRSKKQKVVSRSSAEAEYRGMAQDIVYLCIYVVKCIDQCLYNLACVLLNRLNK